MQRRNAAGFCYDLSPDLIFGMAKVNEKSSVATPRSGKGATRRAILEPALALTLVAPMRVVAQARTSAPEKLRPQPGDRLVFAFGLREGKILKPEELIIGSTPVTALPMSPDTGIVRDGSRLNRVMVIRLDSEALSVKTARSSADGIVAYSAVCSHTGCDISEWDTETQRLVCPCHDSEFEVTDGARVMSGPAPKPLAMLPLEITKGELRVARKFTRRVGAQPQ